MKRRTFIKTTSGIAAAGLVSSLARPLMAISPESKYKNTIGLQVWTVREQMKEDKKKTLKAIADAGYKQVELGDPATVKELMPICKDLGLSVTSSFINWKSICDPKAKDAPKLEKIIEQASAAELKHLVFGYIGKGYREKADQYKAHAEASNKFGEMCNKANIKLCYHNHSFEFEKIDGEKTGFDLFMEHFDNDKCQFELDVFWAKVGGWDPIETLKKLDGQVTQVHLKDVKKGTAVIYDEGKVPHEAFKELGNGTIDMAKVLETCEKIGVEQCHVEQDQSPNPINSIGVSLKHFKSLAE